MATRQPLKAAGSFFFALAWGGLNQRIAPGPRERLPGFPPNGIRPTVDFRARPTAANFAKDSVGLRPLKLQFHAQLWCRWNPFPE